MGSNTGVPHLLSWLYSPLQSSLTCKFEPGSVLGRGTEFRALDCIFTITQKYYPQGQIHRAKFDNSAIFIDGILLPEYYFKRHYTLYQAPSRQGKQMVPWHIVPFVHVVLPSRWGA